MATSNKRNDCSNQRGYTLFQTMMAVLVALLVIGAGVPVLGNAWNNARLRTSVEALINELQLAKMQAVNTNTSVTFNLDSSAGTFQVSGKPQRSLTNSVTFSGTPPSSLIFNSRGRLASGSVQTLSLLGKNGRTYTITINPSGRISIN
jgi:Tfp pilus assembly protein FimT